MRRHKKQIYSWSVVLLAAIALCWYFSVPFMVQQTILLLKAKSIYKAQLANPQVIEPPLELTIHATIDASGAFMFDKKYIYYRHIRGALAENVTINGTPWENIKDLRYLPLEKQVIPDSIVLKNKKARDIIALDKTSSPMVAVFIADTPPGKGDYEFTVQFKVKE